MRELKGFWGKAIPALLILWALGLVYTSIRGAFHPYVQIGVSLAVGMIATFALFPVRKEKVPGHAPSLLDIALMALGVVPSIYIVFNYQPFLRFPGDLNTLELTLSGILFLLLLEGTRRTTGWAIPIMTAVFLLYALWASPLPGGFSHQSFSITYLLGRFYGTTLGYFGQVPSILMSTVAIFMFFGPAIFATGAGDFFLGIARIIGGKIRGGAAQVSVIASAFFGTISGSATANVVTTGSITIPMMKDAGFRPEFAGAVESVAGTGGQIMPPIMGAGAFLMADFLGVSYAHIALVAIIPALIYYFGVAAGIYFESKKKGIGRLNPASVPRARDVFTLRNMLCTIIPIGSLLLFLGIQFTPQFSAAVALIIGFVLHMLWGPLSLAGMKKRLLPVREALVTGGQTLAWLLVMICLIQTIIALIGITGFGVAISQLIFSAGTVSLIAGLVATAVIAMVLGMGMTTTAAYVIAFAVVGKGLIALGVPPLPAHMFIFYYALLSCITPPVCMAIYPAAAIAKANWWTTGWLACRLGVGAYLVPFVWVFSPALLLIGDPLQIALTSLSAVLSVICLSAGTMGYLLISTGVLERLVLIGSGLFLLTPGLSTRGIGLGLLVLCLIYQEFKRRRQMLHLAHEIPVSSQRK